MKTYHYHRCLGRWIGRGGSRHWPPECVDLHPVDVLPWEYVEGGMSERIIEMRDALLCRVLDSAKNRVKDSSNQVILFCGEGPCSRSYGRTAALRLIVQPL